MQLVEQGFVCGAEVADPQGRLGGGGGEWGGRPWEVGEEGGGEIRTVGRIVAEDRTVVLFSPHAIGHRGRASGPTPPVPTRRPPRSAETARGGRSSPRSMRLASAEGLQRPLDRAPGRRAGHEQERPVRPLRLQGGAAALDRPRGAARVLRRGRDAGARDARRASSASTRCSSAWHDYIANDLFPGGCILMEAAAEFDNRPGPVRDLVAETMGDVDGPARRAGRARARARRARVRAPTPRSSPGSCTRSASRSTGTASSTAPWPAQRAGRGRGARAAGGGRDARRAASAWRRLAGTRRDRLAA